MACMSALSQTSARMLVTAESCERNKGPILEVLRREFVAARSVLEIGSGTGQHAVHFAAHLPGLTWQASEVPALLPALEARLRLAGSDRLPAPLALDVRKLPWPGGPVDALFSANTLHIMGMDGVRDFFRGAGAVLGPQGVLCVYGPFNYQGRFTSDSNAQFDAWLRARDAHSGIRDFEALDALARDAGLALHADHAMPANNRTLVWRAA
jgi:cyclopropane fatty-acyl-phospholipid synthase-like methyltransferase